MLTIYLLVSRVGKISTLGLLLHLLGKTSRFPFLVPFFVFVLFQVQYWWLGQDVFDYLDRILIFAFASPLAF